MDLEPPIIPDDALSEWERVDDSTDTLFETAVVSVTGRTLRYESPALGADTAPARFFFATRLRLDPAVTPNAAVTKLVTSGASDGFRDRLSERGFHEIHHEETRTLPIDDAKADLTRFRAKCVTPDGDIMTEALLAIWTADGYRIAGGGFPLTGEVTTSRRDLRRLFRSVR